MQQWHTTLILVTTVTHTFHYSSHTILPDKPGSCGAQPLISELEMNIRQEETTLFHTSWEIS